MSATATPDYRKKLADLMRATLADEALNHDWTYRAVRPCPVPPSWHAGQRVWGDCSKGVQFLNRWAGAADPMGMNYGEWGNSSTLWMNLQHLASARDLLVGDVVTFGHNGDEHAAMVLESGDDPLVWSFGHQGAPNTYRLSQDHRPKQYLRNPLPVYVPTTEDKLRGRTGWFAWMAWYEGEGDWKPYGARNKTVRPSVPRRIPVTWWTRRVKFLARRHKGTPASRTGPASK